MRVLLFLFVALLAPCVWAQAITSPDEASQTIAACGKPLQDAVVVDLTAKGGMSRTLVYRRVSLVFQKNENVWHFLRADRKMRYYTSRETAEQALPCFHKVIWAPIPVESLPRATPSTMGWPTRLLFFILIALGVYVFAQIRKGWRWTYRAERLCLRCRSVQQPNRYRDGRYYCPTCSADNPVPLQSPMAREYFARTEL